MFLIDLIRLSNLIILAYILLPRASIQIRWSLPVLFISHVLPSIDPEWFLYRNIGMTPDWILATREIQTCSTVLTVLSTMECIKYNYFRYYISTLEWCNQRHGTILSEGQNIDHKLSRILQCCKMMFIIL